MKVTVKFVGDSDTETFLLGAREMAGDDLEVFSPQSPLGRRSSAPSKGETVSLHRAQRQGPAGRDRRRRPLRRLSHRYRERRYSMTR